MNAGLLLLLAAAVPSLEPSPSFVLATVEGKAARGTIDRLGPTWQLRLAGNEQTFKSSEWTSLRRSDWRLPPHPAGPHFVLTNGDRIPFVESSLGLAGEQLTFASPWLDNGKTV